MQVSSNDEIDEAILRLILCGYGNSVFSFTEKGKKKLKELESQCPHHRWRFDKELNEWIDTWNENK